MHILIHLLQYLLNILHEISYLIQAYTFIILSFVNQNLRTPKKSLKKRLSDLFGLWVCLMGIALIMLIGFGKPIYCGFHYFLGLYPGLH